jgi:hypothetical protein
VTYKLAGTVGQSPSRRWPSLSETRDKVFLRQAARIGGFGSAASTARLAELFEDAQRDPALRAVLVGMLREADR